MPVKPPKCVTLNRKQMKALKERIKARTLSEEDYDVLQGLAEAVEILGDALKEKDTSLGRLCKYVFGAPTETAKNILKKAEAVEKPKPEKKPGHGRKPASAYTGGEKVVVKHPSLTSGDHCPECEKGKVYELAMPSVSVHFTGGAPLTAKVVERGRLRCNLCGEVFTPELPEDVSDKKHDESAAAMLAILKYGCGLPLNRLERLQGHLGQPLPASTQWGILNASAITLAPVLDALTECAAQGHLIHNDDTTMKVLEFLKETENDDRKGVFTTGIVSYFEAHRIALFMTGHRHAGENLTELLKRRATGLSPPIQMCDALSRNASKEFETILANCLAHARRQFVELVDRFPDDCAHVIEELGKVYHQDEMTKTQSLSPEERLRHHQAHSRPVMDGLKAYCERQIEEKAVEPNSGLGKAINYILRHWEKLTRFLTVPGAPLDNNICERILKFAICHRKNALFYKTEHGAHVGDLFMSLIHTCQFAGTNPLDYLTWLFRNATEIPKDPQCFLPWSYQPPP